ncbi:AIPR family protein [Burkholderia vietnamiensis]|uniref:AIPR family protein n=1 Tax=Burkholderia vietnamiensis TaxID=60552 RepID=UPI001EE6216D|nr:AIPR family protein [Burkholderia vietnamiensis]UKV76431.1 AIPR family protein [Burkholderia vietnamiensis]
MELLEFLHQTQQQIREEISDRTGPGIEMPFEELIFTEVVAKHMADVGMTCGEPTACHYAARVGNANVRLSGFAVSDEGDQLDLFVSLYQGARELTSIADAEVAKAAEHCARFLAACVEGRLGSKMDESNDAYPMVLTIEKVYSDLDQIRIYVLTDAQVKTRIFKSREIGGKTVKLEVMDVVRLYNHWQEGKPRDELVVNFEDVCGRPLPCVWVPGENGEYDYAMTVVPGEALRFLYEKFGTRILEANVRSFLSSSKEVNRGISNTLREAPGRFMAFNNGIVIVADEARIGRVDGGPGIAWLKGMQIVNGGQTTASTFFTKKKYPSVDLGPVRVPAKIIVLRELDPAREEELIADISKYANSQNKVNASDLSANKPFHVAIEKLAMSTFCPDGYGRWFYERAAGSYKVMLEREGKTAAGIKRLQSSIPPWRKITKTDLAKYLCAWKQRPDLVSLGGQKNFKAFMEEMVEVPGEDGEAIPDVTEYKRMIASAILFKAAEKVIRTSKTFPAFQANVTAYTVAVLSKLRGDAIDLNLIWQRQEISGELSREILGLALEVNQCLHRTAEGRMISEWAKKAECWQRMSNASFVTPLSAMH